jgi:hypothetical protein
VSTNIFNRLNICVFWEAGLFKSTISSLLLGCRTASDFAQYVIISHRPSECTEKWDSVAANFWKTSWYVRPSFSFENSRRAKVAFLWCTEESCRRKALVFRRAVNSSPQTDFRRTRAIALLKSEALLLLRKLMTPHPPPPWEEGRPDLVVVLSTQCQSLPSRMSDGQK